jgi:glycerol-3-phosphate dehydrogenase (NAD(P)+)
MKMSVLGAGGWGTTLAILLHYNGHQVTLWEYKKNYARFLSKTRENKDYLPEIKIPPEIKITHDLDESTVNKNIVVFAIPSQFVRGVVKDIPFSNIKNSILISVAKGIEKKTLDDVSNASGCISFN